MPGSAWRQNAISEARFRAFWRQALPDLRRSWALALQNAVNTVRNCYAERWAAVLFALLSLWLAHALRGPCCLPIGFRAVWRASAHVRARPQPQNAAICGVLLRLRFRAGLRAVLFGLLFLRPLARACDPREPSTLGPGWGPEGCHPHLGLIKNVT